MRRSLFHILFSGFLLLGLASCSSELFRARDREDHLSQVEQSKISVNTWSDLDLLAEMMAGSFSSQAHAGADSAFFDIRLEMKPVWTERDDGYWFYVEQAAAAYLDKPYRQRVYHLIETGDGVFESRVFTLRDPIRFAGAFRLDRPLSALTPDSLVLREGCAISMHKFGDGVFRGSTGDRTCPSSLRGATYATSEVQIYPDKLISWDRGWDAEGKQVWGAERGGYIFEKIR